MKGEKYTPRTNDEKDKVTVAKDKGQNLASKEDLQTSPLSRGEDLRQRSKAPPKEQNKQKLIKMASERNAPALGRSGGELSPHSVSRATHAEVAAVEKAPALASASADFREKSSKVDDILLTSKQEKKLTKYRGKAEKSEDKYFQRESKLPKRHALKLTEKQDDGKRKVKLHFE